MRGAGVAVVLRCVAFVWCDLVDEFQHGAPSNRASRAPVLRCGALIRQAIWSRAAITFEAVVYHAEGAGAMHGGRQPILGIPSGCDGRWRYRLVTGGSPDSGDTRQRTPSYSHYNARRRVGARVQLLIL